MRLRFLGTKIWHSNVLTRKKYRLNKKHNISLTVKVLLK